MGMVSGANGPTNGGWICFGCKTWRTSQEAQHKLVQQEAISNLKGAGVVKGHKFPAKFNLANNQEERQWSWELENSECITEAFLESTLRFW